MLVRLPKTSRPQKFSGRGLVLQPGDNQISTPDKKLLALLKRGEQNGKWEIEPAEPKAKPDKAKRVAKKAAKKTAKKAEKAQD